MNHLLIINDKPVRIGSKEQMEQYRRIHPEAFDKAIIVPENEFTRDKNYYYCNKEIATGNELWIFYDNAVSNSNGLPVQTLNEFNTQTVLEFTLNKTS